MSIIKAEEEKRMLMQNSMCLDQALNNTETSGKWSVVFKKKQLLQFFFWSDSNSFRSVFVKLTTMREISQD